jgi:hypothetical protein
LIDESCMEGSLDGISVSTAAAIALVPMHSTVVHSTGGHGLRREIAGRGAEIDMLGRNRDERDR